MTFEEFVAADNELPATEMFTVQEIAASCSSNNVDDGETEEPDDEPQPTNEEAVNNDNASVTLVQSITAFETVRSFIENTADIPQAIFNAVACIQDYLINRPIHVAQPKITQFFNSNNYM